MNRNSDMSGDFWEAQASVMSGRKSRRIWGIEAIETIEVEKNCTKDSVSILVLGS